MQQIESEVSKHDGSVLIAGDFNTRTKERIRYMFDMMKRLKMKEVKFENGHQRMKAKLTDNILDYAFVRGPEVKKALVVGNANGSDHKPMLIEMALR
jgi:endonuclease/exonuclease/phosphatase (EEP) superfamily protein YafD